MPGSKDFGLAFAAGRVAARNSRTPRVAQSAAGKEIERVLRRFPGIPGLPRRNCTRNGNAAKIEALIEAREPER